MHVRTGTALVALSSLFIAVSCSEEGPTTLQDPVAVETEALPEAIEGQSYSQTLEATGGSGGYAWEVATGSLPGGLSLAADGTIAGSPTTPGTASFRVRATDTGGRTATADLSIDVTAALVVHTTTLADAEVGVGYGVQLVAVGGRPAHAWRRAGGSAGAWLTVSSEGALEGTPDAAGSHSVVVAVEDASGQEAIRELALVVRAPLAIVTAAVPEATQWRAYGVQLEATGGDGQYAWEIAGGALPVGLELSAAGAITGPPEESGPFTFTVGVGDGAGRTATRVLTLRVEPAPIIRTTALPPGTPGVAYSVTLQAAGGTGALGWSVADGSLPAGLALSTVGVLSGTPQAAGNSVFTVRVVDEAGAADARELSLPVVQDLQALESGVAVTGLAGDEASSRYFFIDVPAGSGALTVAISGGTGDADLYLRHGALPQDYTYDCRPLRSGNQETCTVPTPAPGAWYIRIRGFTAYGGLSLVATIED